MRVVHTVAASFLALSVLCSTTGASVKEGRFSADAALLIPPLESYPDLGLALAGHYQLGTWRVGGQLSLYLPKKLPNASRNVSLATLSAERDLVATGRLCWSAKLGAGLGLFRDDYDQVFEDVVSLGPGFILGTALEYRATSRLQPYVGLRLVSFFAADAVDDQWIEFGAGARLLF